MLLGWIHQKNALLASEFTLMNSAIYKGWLRHRRFYPREHHFRYEIFMMYLDLEELQAILSLSPWWSDKPWRPARFKRDDFLGDKKVSLDTAVRQRIHEHTGEWHNGPIRLLANWRYFGFSINPISCYYCFDNDQNLKTIVAEVTNTPWNEKTSYVLPCNPNERFQRIQFQKEMHVSPFNPMQMNYKWRSNSPKSMLTLNLETECEGQSHTDATMALQRIEIDKSSLSGILLNHPWMTAKVAASIYWQALKLWTKKTPVYNHSNVCNLGTKENHPTSHLEKKS
jgi:DUF1365 family protein